MEDIDGWMHSNPCTTTDGRFVMCFVEQTVSVPSLFPCILSMCLSGIYVVMVSAQKWTQMICDWDNVWSGGVRMCAVSEWLKFLSLFSYPSVLWCGMDWMWWICCLNTDFCVVCECGSDFVECRPISNLRTGYSLQTNDQSNSCDLEYLCALSSFARFDS